jgi:hypothetical protein
MKNINWEVSNIWKMDVVCLDKDNNVITKNGIKGGIIHNWLKLNNHKIKYDYQHRAWSITGEVTDPQIKSLLALTN